MKSTITKTKTTTPTTKPSSNLSKSRPPPTATTRNSTKPSASLAKSVPPHPPTDEVQIAFKKKIYLTQKRFTSCVLTHISNKPLLVTAGDGQITL